MLTGLAVAEMCRPPHILLKDQVLRSQKIVHSDVRLALLPRCLENRFPILSS